MVIPDSIRNPGSSPCPRRSLWQMFSVFIWAFLCASGLRPFAVKKRPRSLSFISCLRPVDFMFRLTREEFDNLKCQIGISSQWGGRRTLPYAFTEHGAVMAASILNTPRAIKTSVYVVRAFVKLREILSTHKELARKLTELERRLDTHDEAIKDLIGTLRQLMKPAAKKGKKEIGFRSPGKPSPGSRKKKMVSCPEWH